MKLKLFNGKATAQVLHVQGGGYDAEQARVVLFVQSAAGEAVGTLTFDIVEARRVGQLLLQDTPTVSRVGTVDDNATQQGVTT